MPFSPKSPAWADGPAGSTPITATELNRIEAGIATVQSDAAATYATQAAPSSIASVATFTAANEDTAFRVCEYAGKIYVAAGWSQGGVNIGGQVYTIDLATGVLTLAFDTGEQTARSLCVYRDKLYIGTGVGGNVYVWDGTTLTLAHAFTGGSTEIAMVVYKGILYIGETATGLVHSYDGTTWTSAAVTTGDVHVESLAVFLGLLWIGTGNSPAAYHILTYDGTNAGIVYTSANANKSEALALCAYRGKIYASEFDPTGACSLVEYDPTTGLWTSRAIPTTGGGTTACYTMTVYRDRLLIGTHPNGQLFAFDGAGFTTEGAATLMQSLRDLVVADDRVLIAARANGTPSTGGALFSYGDGNRRQTKPAEPAPHVPVIQQDLEWLGSFDPRTFDTSLTFPLANRAYMGRRRVTKPTYIGHLRTIISVSSGNLCLAVYKGDGATIATVDGVAIPGPGTRVVTTGVAVSPGTGVREFAVVAGTGTWLLPGDYWWAIQGDNTTVEVYGVNLLAPTMGELTGFADTTFPLPATAPALTATARIYPCWH